MRVDTARSAQRKLRSGKEFSPYKMPLDFASLLKNSESTCIPMEYDERPQPSQQLTPCSNSKLDAPHETQETSTFHEVAAFDHPSKALPSVPHEILGPDTPCKILQPIALPMALDDAPINDSLDPKNDDPGLGRLRPSAELVPEKQRYKAYKRRMARMKAYGEGVRSSSAKKRAEAAASSRRQATTLCSNRLPALRDGYAAKIARSSVKDSAQNWTAQGLLENGFSLVQWDGRTPRPLVDSGGRIFAVLAGRPKDPSFEHDCQAMYSSMQAELRGFHLKETDTVHRRGNFPALAVGVSYGNGQRQPMRLIAGETSPQAPGLQRLLNNPAVQRVAAYGDSAFQMWAPKLYNHYRTHVEKMYDALPHIRRNFSKSVFPCATFNFGPRVQTIPHRDSLNLGYGWCSITALGCFNPTEGGHLILWDARVVVEFPPNSTALIPSSTILHSNIAVGVKEERASFTQYCAGGIFRWVDNGCRTQLDFQKADPASYCAAMEDRLDGWERGLAMYEVLRDI
ncbi:hypothetical protein PTI98_009484 [Pleurotus ostreatus]|nr:hypothetical protein PTI98_009484 [Pleurotus ostreatus]